jgi:hypothetical protein
MSSSYLSRFHSFGLASLLKDIKSEGGKDKLKTKITVHKIVLLFCPSDGIQISG